MATTLGGVGVVLYAFESNVRWVQVWVPAIAAALLVGALTVLALDIIVDSAVEQARLRRLEPLRSAASEEMYSLREKVDRFLEKWQQVIGQLRGDYAEVVMDETATGRFPDRLVTKLPSDTLSLLWSGWGQPYHERIPADASWEEVVQLGNQVKRQSDRIVEWYSEALDPSVPAALGGIQEYLLCVVENVPRTGRTDWFNDDGPHANFLVAYRAIWPDDDPRLEEARSEDRGIWRAIFEGLRQGTAELHAQERDREYTDPALVALYDAVHPGGQREDCYIELIMSARAVLDLGCGTGRLLKRAAQADDSRVLVGIDRSNSMLHAAESAHDNTSYSESRINWQSGDVRTIDLDTRFDLITMTGQTFHEILTDSDMRMVLSNVIRHLDPGGRFAFDLRQGDGGPIEGLVAGLKEVQVETASGGSVEIARVVEQTTEPGVVDFVTTYSLKPSHSVVSRSFWRSIDLDYLRALLEDVGFRVDGWLGHWGRAPLVGPSVDDLVVVTRVP